MKYYFQILLWITETYPTSQKYKDLGYQKDFPIWVASFAKYIATCTNVYGLPHTVKIIKSIRLHVTRYISGSPLIVNDLRIAIARNGLPVLLRPLFPLIVGGDPKDLRLVLTALNVMRSVSGDGTLDTKTITSPRLGDPFIAMSLERNIKRFTEQFMTKYIPLLPEDTLWSEPHTTTKRGPNGHALGSALIDLGALPQELRKSIVTLGGEALGNTMDKLQPAADGLAAQADNHIARKVRRISVIADKECKNRPIAIFDYWSQTSLVPLHDALFRVLRKLPTDSTHNQDSITQVLDSHYSTFHSIDLTAATDRFPVSLQESILSLFIGVEKANAWRNIMSQPLQTPSGRTISYEVGQPMGAYSSWATFTLCHHLIIQFSAYVILGIRDAWWTDYRVLGDDVVIFNNEVAEHYRQVLQVLGVTTSEAKTHVSKDTFEFAKRWFTNGYEVSPFPINAVIEARSDPHQIGISLYDATRKAWHTLKGGVPDEDQIRRLLSSIGWGVRGQNLRSLDIRKTSLFYLTLDYLDTLPLVGEMFVLPEGTMNRTMMSMYHRNPGCNDLELTQRKGARLALSSLISCFGPLSCVANPLSWIGNFVELAFEVKREQVTNDLATAFNRLARAQQVALQAAGEMSKACNSSFNPYTIFLDIPFVRVLGLETRKLQALNSSMSEKVSLSPREVFSWGADIQFPDPDTIRSVRTSQVIARKTGSLLHKLFRVYDSVIAE